MWMQLGCRAFLKGNKKRLLKRKDGEADSKLQICDEEIDDNFSANLSMNELMRIIYTLASTNKRNRVIVSNQNNQEKLEVCHLQALETPKIPNSPLNYCLSCKPQFNFDQNVQDLGVKITPSLTNRILSFDNLLQLKTLSLSESLSWKVYLDGALAPISRIYENNVMHFDNAINLYPSEMVSFMVPVDRNYLKINCEDHLEAFVVPATNRKSEASKITFMMSEELVTEKLIALVPQNEKKFYWINIAHLLVLIACLRGLL